MLGFTTHYKDNWIVAVILIILAALALPNLLQVRRDAARAETLAPVVEAAERARASGKLPDEARARRGLTAGLDVAQVASVTRALSEEFTVVLAPPPEPTGDATPLGALAVREGWLVLHAKAGQLSEPALQPRLPGAAGAESDE